MVLKSKRIISVLLVLTFVFVVVGCGSSTVAQVNGEKITQSQLDKRINKQKKLMEAQGAGFKAKKGDKTYKALEKQVLDGMIEELVTVQAAKKESALPTDKEVDQKLKEIKKSFKTQQEYKDALSQFGFTESEMKDYLKQQLASTKLMDKLTRSITVSDADVKKYYDEHKDEMKQPESIKIRDILVNTEADANKAIADLKAGKDFAQEAKEKSVDPKSKDNGGLYVDQQGGIEFWTKGQGLDRNFGKEVEDAAFALKKGAISQVVKGQNGFYIIKLEDKKEAKQLGLDEVKSSLTLYVTENKKQEKLTQYISDYKKKIEIKTFLK